MIPMSRETTRCLLLVTVVLLVVFFDQGHSIVTHCGCFEGEHNRPDICPPPDYTIECAPGTTHCYYRRFLLNDRPVEDFGCFQTDVDIIIQICEEGRNNNDRNQWRCCETDNCNADFEQIVLPAEILMITDRETVSATIGRTTTAEGAENGTMCTHGLDPELIKIIVVGVFSVALGLIVLLILIVACVILYYRRKVQNHCSTSRTSGVPNRHGIVENEMDLSFGDTLTSRLSIAESDQEKDVACASQFSAIPDSNVQSRKFYNP